MKICPGSNKQRRHTLRNEPLPHRQKWACTFFIIKFKINPPCLWTSSLLSCIVLMYMYLITSLLEHKQLKPVAAISFFLEFILDCRLVETGRSQALVTLNKMCCARLTEEQIEDTADWGVIMVLLLKPS